MKRTGFIYFFICYMLSQCIPFLAFSQTKNDRTNKPPKSSESDTVPVSYVTIDRIFIVGNRKTKERIIRRELDISEGAKLDRSRLDGMLESDRKKILNTRLFLTADIEVVDLSQDMVDVIIRVNERWYFFPVPIFSLADRNFTEWWVNQKRDLSRVEYGIKLKQFNFRGRNETVSLTAQFGYTKLLQLSYQIPYIDRKQKIGLMFYGDYSTNKNIAYQTIEHRLNFIDSDNLLRERFRYGAYLTYRPSFYTYHQFGLFQSSTFVKDTIVQINPNYFLDGKDQQRYFGFYYAFTNDHRDYVNYPLSGYYFKIGLTQTGLGFYNDVNILKLTVHYSKYFDLGKKFYFSTNLAGMVSSPKKQPYRNYNGVGYSDDFIRGYEIYVIEGQHYIINNNSLKKRLFSWKYDFGTMMPLKQFNTIPISGYLTLNFDQGYIANYENYTTNRRFTDKYIVGGGIGVDIISFYDFVMRWEYSINIAGEKALYLNIKAAF